MLKKGRRYIHIVLSMITVIGVLALNGQISPAHSTQAAPPNLSQAQIGVELSSISPFISPPVPAKASPALSDLAESHPEIGSVPARQVPTRHHPRPPTSQKEADLQTDPLLAISNSPTAVSPSPKITFAGISYTGFVPPDTIGDVGPNHYVQAVNVHLAVFDKHGVLLSGPTAINLLWTGQGNACEQNNDGDPVILYDPLADRWLIAQFALPNPYFMCIAISQTPDPTGAYFTYQFQVPDFPDYPKLGVWPDGYYMSTNESNAAAYAFDRVKMLQGQPATFQRFTNSGNFMLPSDLDGTTAPPVGSPNYFYTFVDSSFWGGLTDRLEIWAFHIDFNTPANSTFALVQSLPVTPFNYTVCGYFNFNCIPQPATTRRVDAISEWPMWRWAYRNFGAHESLVGNFTVDVDNTDHAGIRWFELRRTGASWMLFQEGTHAPDAHNRWIGSAAMDRQGNMALGYSVSSASLFPSIRYAVRLATDPPGSLQAESELIAGTGSQTGSSRWGDYSALSIDPQDDCTFWYTNEYYPVTSPTNWHTRIGAFILPECANAIAPNLIAYKQVSDPLPMPGDTLTYTISLTNTGSLSVTGVVISDTLPTGVIFTGPITVDPPGSGDPGLYPPILVSDLSLAPGQAVIVTVPVIVSTDLPDGSVITNTVSITSSEIITPILRSAIFTNTWQADLQLITDGLPPTMLVNVPLTRTFEISNLGPMTATSVTFTETFSGAGLLFGEIKTSQGSCGHQTGELHCQLGDLAPGGQLIATVTITPTQSGSLQELASVGSPVFDSVSENNHWSSGSSATFIADLSLYLAAVPVPVNAGEPLQFTITVTNAGPSPAPLVAITDTLPVSTTFLTASPECNQVSLSVVLCAIASLETQAHRVLTITVFVASDTPAVINTSATVTSAALDPNPADNQFVFNQPVSPYRWRQLIPVVHH